MKTSMRLTLAAASFVATAVSAQDLEQWDFGRMRNASDCDTLSKTNFIRLMAYQAIENRKIQKMNIPPQQKQQMGYDVYRQVQEHNRSEEDMRDRCRQHFEDKQR
jgi:hypothetical protein